MSEKTNGFKIEESQRQSWLSIAAVWAGGMICVPCLMIGGVLAGGGLSLGVPYEVSTYVEGDDEALYCGGVKGWVSFRIRVEETAQ